ncbi:MAG: hypothetical protein K2O18_13730 [Oscillospiraceae bacterium]|nr:hypothetical protein [Oscillospiraceae bacterium]
MKESITVTHTMADGSLCEDVSTYLKSPDQLSKTSIRMIRMFIENGYKILAEQRKQEQGGGE